MAGRTMKLPPLQGVRHGQFFVETKCVDNQYGNAVPMLVISAAPGSQIEHYRHARAMAYTLAASVELLSKGHEWRVGVTDQYGTLRIELSLHEGSPAELARAKAVLVKVLAGLEGGR